MANQKAVLEVLSSVNAVITDSHIVYTSRKHGSAYVNKDAVYPYTRKTSWLCSQIAKTFENDGVEVVIAPAVGAVILSQWTAHHLSSLTGRDVLSAYADKASDGGFIIKRGYDKLIKGKRVLIVEDVINTGGSAKETVVAVRSCGGLVIGVGALCNRGDATPESLGDVPGLVALVDVQMDAWDEKDCPLCKARVPINTDVGKGLEFKRAHEIL